MALPSWASQTVTIIRPGVKIERGSEVPDWNNTWETDVPGCSVQPASTDMSQDGRVLGVFDGITCYMPPGTNVREGDRIQYDGVTYMILGAPRRWQSPTGRASHIQVNIRRWDG